ncbi:MAG: UvrD-helicase domain-containing protein [Bryobacteraceae bacterium]|jgi:ATP-dependent exoDNAse (exonuclease V) beta subunit
MTEIDFTPAQRAAIEVAGPPLDTCVVAGPGSGKTTVLVEHFRQLVEAGVSPQRILAITFTEKAAANMRAKLAEACPEIRAQLERAWVSTVHGFCTRLLKENAVFAAVDPEFSVADPSESWRLQQESIAAAIDELFEEQPGAVRALIRGLSAFDFEEALLSAYDAMRSAGKRVEDLAGFAQPAGTGMADFAATAAALAADAATTWSIIQKLHLADIRESAERIVHAPGPLEALHALAAFPANLRKSKSGTTAYSLVKSLKDQAGKLTYSLITELYRYERRTLVDILRRFDRIYRERKQLTGTLDFADLEEFAVRFLDRDRQARDRLKAQFDHILMDEFQDTNPQQAWLLELVRSPNRFYAVGDVNQSIFGFRHAEPAGFERYRGEVEAAGSRLVPLHDNFRSRPQILNAAETITTGAPGIERRTLVARREFARPRDAAVEVICATADDAAAALEIEARWVARRVVELLDELPEFTYKDIALLVRNTEVIPQFALALEEAGVPYLVNRGKGFYDSREVNDLVHLLRAIANPRDEISLAVVLRSPLVTVSDEALLALRLLAENLSVALARLGAETESEFEADDFRALIDFRDRLRRWRVLRESVGFDRLLADAIDDCGCRSSNGARGAANIDKLLAQARAAAGRVSLDQFVAELEVLRESDLREPDAPPEDSADAVEILTVHSAKGLEFPIVFVAALQKGVASGPPVVAFSPRVGLGARWRNPADGDDKDDVFQHAIREERKQREEEESNRLLYVAMTRAEQHLALTFSATARKTENWAKLVSESLQLPLTETGDRVIDRAAPDGKPWKLRLLVTDRAPELLLRVPAARTAGAASPATTWLDAPAVTEQQDANATVTALVEYARCPRRYYLGHYLGFDGRSRGVAEPGEGLPASDLGTQVHKLLAGEAVADADDEALRLADNFRNSALGRRAAKATRAEREFDFLMAVDDLVIRGQVDLWFEEGGELVIVDYKTDAVNLAEAHRRAQDYALQLRLYAMAVEQLTGRAADRAYLCFLRPNATVEIDLAPSLIESPSEVVREFQEAQDSLRFPLNEEEHCHGCPFFHDLCPATGG